MSGTLYRKYVNIQKFAVDYRKFLIEGNFLNRKQFKKTIQLEQYVVLNCRNPKTGRATAIFLMKSESKYIGTTPAFRKLLDSMGSEPAVLYFITKEPFSIYINKIIHEYPHYKIHNLLHKHFSIEITKGPHCSEHTILSDEEAERVCFQDLMIHPLNIPPIFVSDPICIWIGAEVGQILSIRSKSENAGTVVRYRIVSPCVGKIPENKTPSQTAMADRSDGEHSDAEPEEPEVDAEPEEPEVDAEPEEPEVDAEPEEPEVDAEH